MNASKGIIGNGTEEDRLADLVKRTIAGDERAWGALWLVLDPRIERIAGQRRLMGPLSVERDERRDVVVRVMGQLQEDGFRRLGELLEVVERRDGSFWCRITTIVKSAAVDHVRAHAENVGSRSEARWAVLGALSEQIEDGGPGVLAGIEAREILALAATCLTPAQYDALCLWISGETFEEIARELRLEGPLAARKMMRAAVKRLRDRLVPEEEEEIDRCE